MFIVHSYYINRLKKIIIIGIIIAILFIGGIAYYLLYSSDIVKNPNLDSNSNQININDTGRHFNVELKESIGIKSSP